MSTKDIDSTHSCCAASHRRLGYTSAEPPPGIPCTDHNGQGTKQRLQKDQVSGSQPQSHPRITFIKLMAP